ncbi:MAG TPA: ABC transporter substrate-binding protein [Xanthobacteraceae bacterium]|nr:ABC transporter substrate-binding protein [Xanthobacteraceae bacterium]
MRRREFCLGLVAMPALARSAFAQEVASITLIKQHGLPYLPMMVMEEQKLVEKHAARLGVPNLKTDYRTLGGTQSIIDALIGGSMHFGIAGVPGLATLWDKTVGTANEVRALCAAQAMPFILVTNRPEIKTIKDFKEGHKIAVPGVKNSNQAICLQMAAAKEWGQANYAQLDPFTITLPHPDAAIAIISRSTELAGHYGVSPFQDYELAAPGTHQVLKSYDTLGGPTTNGVVFMAKKFRDANPKVTAAVYAAFEEVSAFIKKEPRQSGEIYIRMTNEKRSNADQMAKLISNPDNVWATTPLNAMRYVEFMHKVGTMKKQPSDWKDMFMPEVHALKGS